MHELEAKLEPIMKMKEQLVDICKAEMGRGLEQVDTNELGEVIDMIKDLAEAEKFCYEAHYYKSIVCAMDKQGDMEAVRLGYNMGRMGATGGGNNGSSNSYSGGHSGSSGSSGSMGGSAGGGSGYSWPDPSSDLWADASTSFQRSMGRQGMVAQQEEMKPRQGQFYEDWKRARRNYTETGRQIDKDEMSSAGSAHVASAISTMRDIWGSADQDQKKRMKEDLQNLLNEMK